eukprot:gene16662-18357_t
MRKQRWELLGHILRRDRKIPAFRAMELYFESRKAKGFKGKPRTTLSRVLNEDLNMYHIKDKIKAEHNYCHHLKLNNKKDLEELRAMAQDRKLWSRFKEEVVKAGEAATHIGGAAELL